MKKKFSFDPRKLLDCLDPPRLEIIQDFKSIKDYWDLLDKTRKDVEIYEKMLKKGK